MISSGPGFEVWVCPKLDPLGHFGGKGGTLGGWNIFPGLGPNGGIWGPREKGKGPL